MQRKQFKLQANVWLHPGENASWHFVTVPKKESTQITKQFKSMKKGWGSLPVEVKIGKTVWTTSIFPDSKSGTYLLPLKAKIRRTEGIEEGDTVSVTLTITV
jgi:hypothetical protein